MKPDQLHDAYLYAIGKGIKQAAIAEQTGIPVESLRKFKQGQPLGPERRQRLLDWMKENNLWLEAQRSDPALVIARELRNLADVLESGIEIETKRSRLTSFINDYRGGRFLAAEEPEDYGV